MTSRCIESPEKGTSGSPVCRKQSLRRAPGFRNSNENFGCCRQRFQVIGGSSDPDRDVTCLDIVSGHCDAGRCRHSKSHVDRVALRSITPMFFLTSPCCCNAIQEAALPVRGFSFHRVVMNSSSTTTMRLAIPIVASHEVEAQTRERLMPIEVISGAGE